MAKSKVYKRLVEINAIDFYHFFVPGAENLPNDISLKSTYGVIRVYDALKVFTLLSQMARLQVAQIDNYVAEVLKKANLKRAEEPRNFIISKELNALSALSKYKVDDLAIWVSGALELEFSTVKNAFSILDFVRSSKQKQDEAWLNWQVLFLIDKNIHWLPNALAYTSPAELLFNTIIGQKIVQNGNDLISMSENSITGWFKNAGFKTIDENEKKYGQKAGSDKGDFDVLAYKNGHLYHLEIKYTKIHNDLLKKISFKESRLHKARKQLSTGSKYIQENKKEISERLGLEGGEYISEDKIHSYLVTNSVDFDKQKIGKFLKFSIMELFVALNNGELYL